MLSSYALLSLYFRVSNIDITIGIPTKLGYLQGKEYIVQSIRLLSSIFFIDNLPASQRLSISALRILVKIRLIFKIDLALSLKLILLIYDFSYFKTLKAYLALYSNSHLLAQPLVPIKSHSTYLLRDILARPLYNR